ncbi:MAG: hypothetical protein M3Z24_15280 [Chloroflexota bacterium]|nr:hypothetical protein [Chloroflexota bacterium]
MRYFLYDENHIIALPPDAYRALTAWVHYPDGSIEREHLKGSERLSLFTEVTEEQARLLDPVMFQDCLDRPYSDAPTLKAFYQMRYEEQLASSHQEGEKEYGFKNDDP